MYSMRRAFSVEQHLNNNMASCAYNFDNQAFPGNAEVICPAPRRATRVLPYIMEDLDRSLHRPKSILPMHRGDAGLEILNIYLGAVQDNSYKDGFGGSDELGFFCGSPPVRTGNPVVHDAQFGRQVQSQLFLTPMGNSHGGPKHAPPPSASASSSSSSSSRSPSCGVSFGSSSSPRVRIEGFACGSSESHCIVQALA